MEKYLKSLRTPTIDITNVTLSVSETFQWIFSGLNVNVSQCRLHLIRIIVESESRLKDGKHLVENQEIMIHNSSFGSIDLEPGAKAQISDCYIDGEFKDRPTLIRANNSDVSIQNCQFKNFLNEQGSTILFGHSNSHVTIENSVFIKHNTSKGVLLLQNSSSMSISSSSISQNNATSLGYSTITLKNGINTFLKTTTFKNNSAIAGGALIAQEQCQVKITNCNFCSNKATTGKTSSIQKILNKQRASHRSNENGTYKSISSTFLNQTSSRFLPSDVHNRDRNNTRPLIPMSLPLFNLTSEEKKIASHQVHFLRPFTSKKTSGQKNDVLPGFGAAIYLAVQSHLLVINCAFENNSAQWGGAIAAQLNVTLDIEKTMFVGNKASRGGGTIFSQHQVHLQIISCEFEDNTCQQLGGAIGGAHNITLDIHKTNFTRNRASVQGGAIDIDTHTHLRSTDCIFTDNHAGQGGAIGGCHWVVLEINGSYFSQNSASGIAGAIGAANNVTLDIQETSFVRNKASNVGAIDVEQKVHLRVWNCAFHENFCQGTHGIGGTIHGGFNATLNIQETNFTQNRASQGGAIDVELDVYLCVIDCTFRGNYAGNTGGVVSGASDVVLEISRSYFLDNSAGTAGVIIALWNVTLDVQETSFVGNKAFWVGAIWIQEQVYLGITDCLFENNTSQQRSGTIHGETNVTVEIQGTYFSCNSGVDGGAIFAADHAALSLTNCRLERNFASNAGGAVIVQNNVKLEIRETKFTGNTAYENGGALSVSQAECHIVRSVFNGNSAKTTGGAVHIDSKSSVKIENTDFTNNNGSDGGAIYVEENSKLPASIYSTAVIASCRFLLNHAVTGSGGAVQLNNPEYVSVRDTLFLRNVASDSGGAIEISGGTVTIDNITCIRNRVSVQGGCLDIDSVTLTLNNSEISENDVEIQYGLGVSITDSRIQVGFFPLPAEICYHQITYIYN